MTTHGWVLTLAALLPLSTACTDSTRPVSPVPVEEPAPQPPPPPASPGPPAPSPARPDHIYIANKDGSAPIRLTLGSQPSWSPDGRRIAFQRAAEVHVINVDGSNEIRVAAGTWPAWSPDGMRIVFTSSDGISVMNVDGSAARTIIRHDFREDTYEPWDMGVGKPAWSPDGARIAFEHLGDGDTQPAQIFVMGADGSAPRLLTRSHNGWRAAESDPAWSPDGSSIVFWSYGYGITVVDSRGGVPSTIHSAFPAIAYGAKPVWSPDGKAIAYNRDRYSPARAIYIMTATGSDARILIPDGYDLTWSPDGTRIAFVSQR